MKYIVFIGLKLHPDKEVWCGSIPRKETSERSEERNQGTEEETSYPTRAVDVLIGEEEQNGKQKEEKKRKEKLPTQLP